MYLMLFVNTKDQIYFLKLPLSLCFALLSPTPFLQLYSSLSGKGGGRPKHFDKQTCSPLKQKLNHWHPRGTKGNESAINRTIRCSLIQCFCLKPLIRGSQYEVSHCGSLSFSFRNSNQSSKYILFWMLLHKEIWPWNHFFEWLISFHLEKV